MKRRFVAAGLAAATALSLSAAPAQAQYRETSSLEKIRESSSERYTKADNAGKNAKADRIERDFENFESMLASSYLNDSRNEYPYGTTFDILWGTALALTIVGGLAGFAVQQGLVQLPKLPF